LIDENENLLSRFFGKNAVHDYVRDAADYEQNTDEQAYPHAADHQYVLRARRFEKRPAKPVKYAVARQHKAVVTLAFTEVQP